MTIATIHTRFGEGAFDSNAGVQIPLRLKGPFPTLPSKLVQMEVMSG